MKDNKTCISGGVGFSGLLAIAFIVLKLTGCIGWDWIWVLAPIWISTLISVACIILAIVIYKLKDKS